MDNVFRRFDVHIRFRDKLLGGIPKTDDLAGGWLLKRASMRLAQEQDQPHPSLGVESEDDVLSRIWSGFLSSKHGLGIQEANIRGLMKEASRVLLLSRKRGFILAVSRGLACRPTFILLTRRGRAILKPDGFVERAAHVLGRQGPLSVIKREDYVEKAELAFEMLVSAVLISDQELYRMLEAGREIGLGASRALGYGKFDYDIKKIS